MTSKSVLILHTSLRRNLIELDLIPTILRHQSLKDIDTSTEDRQSLTILLSSHSKILTSDLTKTLRLTRRSILRLHPLCEQRRSLTLNVKFKLILHNLHSICFKSSPYENIKIIPTTKLRNMNHVAASRLRILLSKILHCNSEKSTLTLTTAHVAQIKQTLQSISRILCKSLTEHKDYIFV